MKKTPDLILESPDRLLADTGLDLHHEDETAFGFFVMGEGGAIAKHRGVTHGDSWKEGALLFTGPEIEEQYRKLRAESNGETSFDHLLMGRMWALNKPVISMWASYAETMPHVKAISKIVAIRDRTKSWSHVKANALWEFSDSLRNDEGETHLIQANELEQAKLGQTSREPGYVVRAKYRNDKLKAQRDLAAFHALDPVAKMKLRQAGKGMQAPEPVPDRRGDLADRFRRNIGDSKGYLQQVLDPRV